MFWDSCFFRGYFIGSLCFGAPWRFDELFDFDITGGSLSFNNEESLRESGIKIVGTDFDSSYERKSNSSAPVSASSILT